MMVLLAADESQGIDGPVMPEEPGQTYAYSQL
jgi:hypothetical protein